MSSDSISANTLSVASNGILDMYAGSKIQIADGGQTYQGANGQITWTAGGTAHSLVVKKGIITGLV